jgi:hypothetical protein
VTRRMARPCPNMAAAYLGAPVLDMADGQSLGSIEQAEGLFRLPVGYTGHAATHPWSASLPMRAYPTSITPAFAAEHAATRGQLLPLALTPAVCASEDGSSDLVGLQ